MMSKPILYALNALLFIALSTSAVALLWVSHETRNLLRVKDELEQQQHQLEIHWEQLLLEQAALGAHGRIEQLARDRLQMKYPTLADQDRLNYGAKR